MDRCGRVSELSGERELEGERRPGGAENFPGEGLTNGKRCGSIIELLHWQSRGYGEWRPGGAEKISGKGLTNSEGCGSLIKLLRKAEVKTKRKVEA